MPQEKKTSQNSMEATYFNGLQANQKGSFNPISNQGLKDLVANIPATGGSQLAERLKLQFYSENTSYNFYVLYLELLKYQTNIFQITGDEVLERAWPAIMYTLYAYGSVGLFIAKDHSYVHAYALNQTKQNPNGEIIEADGLPANLMNMGSSIFNTTHRAIKLNKRNAVFAKAGQFSFPVLVEWFPALTQLDYYLRIIQSTVKVVGKKILYRVKNSSQAISQLEVDTMLNPDNPFIIQIAGGDGVDIKNQIEPFNLQTSIVDLIEGYKALKNVWYDIFGRRRGDYAEIKKERTNMGESSMFNESASIAEFDVLRWLILMVRDYNKKTGRNAKIIRTGQSTQSIEAQMNDVLELLTQDDVIDKLEPYDENDQINTKKDKAEK